MAIIRLSKPIEEIAEGFEPIPEGTYSARIVKAELTKSQAGNDMIVLTFEVMDGEFRGRKLWDRLVLTDNALWKVARYLKRVLGIESGDEFDVDDFVGAECVVTVGVEESIKEGGGLINVITDVDSL